MILQTTKVKLHSTHATGLLYLCIHKHRTVNFLFLVRVKIYFDQLQSTDHIVWDRISTRVRAL